MASAGAARPTGPATSAAAVRAPARARWVRVDSVMVPPREVFLPVEEPGGGLADTEVRSVVSRRAWLAPQPPGRTAALAPQTPGRLASLAPQPPGRLALLAPQPPGVRTVVEEGRSPVS